LEDEEAINEDENVDDELEGEDKKRLFDD